MKKKQSFEKKNLKLDNPEHVERKKLEQKVLKKQFLAKFTELSKNEVFISYMYDLIALSEYWTSGAGPVNGQNYEKKGKLFMANKIVDDLTFLTEGGIGITRINQMRREAHGDRVVEQLMNEGKY